MYIFKVKLWSKDGDEWITLDGDFDDTCKKELFDVLYHASALNLDVILVTDYYEEPEKEN